MTSRPAGRRPRRIGAGLRRLRLGRRSIDPAPVPDGARGRLGSLQAADLVWAAAFVALAGLYFWRLDAWLINDDEGSYLYAAWRIALGELPYRDFLTPQLPAFLLPGGALMHLVGPSAWAARALAVTLTLGAGWCVWAAARRLFGAPVAALAGVAVLLHPTVFADYRTYRPDAFMLFFASLAVLLFVRAAFPRPGAVDPPDRRWLALSGLVFGLASLSKLFGPMPLAGCLAWLVVDGYTRRRPWRAIATDVAVTVIPSGLVVAVGLGAFAALSSGVFDAVAGHHLRQGAGQSPWHVLWKGLIFYTEFLRYDNNALLAFGAIVVAVAAWRVRDRRALLFAWQLPTALVFLALSRQLFVRHMAYLVPAMATLFAVGIWWLVEGARQAHVPGPGASATASDPLARRWRWLAGAVVAGLLVPWAINDRHRAWEWETGTTRASDLIALLTEPTDTVLSDYSELNFYAQRSTTYSGASLSEGALRSGQIAFRDPDAQHRLEEEFARTGPRLLVLDASPEFAHLRFLRDYPAFENFIGTRFQRLGFVRRHAQVYDVYLDNEDPPPTVAAYDGGPTLLATGVDRTTVAPGEILEVTTAWRTDEAIDARLVASLRLVDAAGREWAQGDEAPRASGASDTRLRATEAWQPGELVADRTRLVVPPGTPPGSYAVTLGLYRDDTLALLGSTDLAGNARPQRTEVARVTVAADTRAGRPIPTGAIDLRASGAARGNLRLLGRGPLPSGPVMAGTTFPLDLWWETRGPVGDLSASITLADPERGAIAFQRTEPLGVPGTPSSVWPSGGAVVRQALRVAVLADAGGGSYRLGVLPAEADGSAPGWDAAPPGGFDLFADLGAIEVVPRDRSTVVTEIPAVDRPLDATVGDVAALVGVDVAPTVPVSGPLEVSLVWRALSPSTTPYKVTLQLLSDDGTPVAQHDGEPADWTRPTTGWLPGEIVVDRHVLDLPADLGPGTYRLAAALYDPGTLRRLPPTGSDASGDMVDLGNVTVRRRPR